MVPAFFGDAPGGQAVHVLTLTNPHGLEARALTYGGVIQSLRVPDREGRFEDVALGYDELEPYLTNPPYFGAVIGRYCNRIAKGRFVLDGRTCTLAVNNGPNHLHGGVRGFDKAVWRAEPLSAHDGDGVAFTHESPDGDEGYPGHLSVRVAYTLTPRNELIVDYRAVSDKATPVSLTQHTCFNLAGAGRGDVLGHELTVPADLFTPADDTLIPTGEIASVEGTPFDFRRATAIGARIGADDEQLRNGRGYDHNFVLNRDGPGLVHAARLRDPTSGRVADVHTTEPGMHVYTGNFLEGTVGKAGRVYPRHAGVCLETQHFPDSPNQPHFPSTIVRPGEEYRSQTVFTFGVRP